MSTPNPVIETRELTLPQIPVHSAYTVQPEGVGALPPSSVAPFLTPEGVAFWDKVVGYSDGSLAFFWTQSLQINWGTFATPSNWFPQKFGLKNIQFTANDPQGMFSHIRVIYGYGSFSDPIILGSVDVYNQGSDIYFDVPDGVIATEMFFIVSPFGTGFSGAGSYDLTMTYVPVAVYNVYIDPAPTPQINIGPVNPVKATDPTITFIC